MISDYWDYSMVKKHDYIQYGKHLYHHRDNKQDDLTPKIATKS